MVCFKCGSERTVLVDKGRKVKCLDCHRTVNKGSIKLPTSKDDRLAVEVLVRRATAHLYLNRDRLGDDEDESERDIEKNK